jgi:hypothetical protein
MAVLVINLSVGKPIKRCMWKKKGPRHRTYLVSIGYALQSQVVVEHDIILLRMSGRWHNKIVTW